jgi:sterol desaturase/sphingolipid hydroxylase (fatty acid hydroxylase superfamily)
VAESVGTMMPYGILSLLGVRPSLIARARGYNLLWQFWIHTEAIRSLGPGEVVLSTPSAHRVHHGSNRRYLDRNHGGVLIVWDRLFGTYEPEGEEVVYGLTKNIDAFDAWTIATHEYRAMFYDVAHATSWRARLGHVAGPPGWRPAAPALTS